MIVKNVLKNVTILTAGFVIGVCTTCVYAKHLSDAEPEDDFEDDFEDEFFEEPATEEETEEPSTTEAETTEQPATEEETE